MDHYTLPFHDLSRSSLTLVTSEFSFVFKVAGGNNLDARLGNLCLHLVVVFSETDYVAAPYDSVRLKVVQGHFKSNNSNGMSLKSIVHCLTSRILTYPKLTRRSPAKPGPGEVSICVTGLAHWATPPCY